MTLLSPALVAVRVARRAEEARGGTHTDSTSSAGPWIPGLVSICIWTWKDKLFTMMNNIYL